MLSVMKNYFKQKVEMKGGKERVTLLFAFSLFLSTIFFASSAFAAEVSAGNSVVETPFKGCIVRTSGAKIDTTSIPGEVIFIYDDPAASGSLVLPTNVISSVLVVGGGGGGASGKKGTNRYYGDGGSGGQGEIRTGVELPAGTYSIAVGNGGKGVEGGKSDPEIKQGEDGQPSTFAASSDVSGFEAMVGPGGAKGGGTSHRNKNSSPGADGFGSSDITGKGVTYGAAGAGVTYSSRDAEGKKPGANGAAGTGAGGGGAGCNSMSGAGGSGVVVVRLSDIAEPPFVYRAATVKVIDVRKRANDPEPVFRTENTGFDPGDSVALTWTAWRTDTSESAGVYDVIVVGERYQGEYEITYVNGTLTIEDPPEPKVVPVTDLDKPISGTDPDDIRIVSETGVDITGAFTLSGSASSGVTAELNPEGAVTVGEGDAAETVLVVPCFTDVGDQVVEPLEVEADRASFGVKSIPGLVYKLRRGAEVEAVPQGSVVDSKRAEATRTKLSDPFEGGRPAKAFYHVEVSK